MRGEVTCPWSRVGQWQRQEIDPMSPDPRPSVFSMPPPLGNSHYFYLKCQVDFSF